MKTAVLIFGCSLLIALRAAAQLCPGGGVDFLSAVSFDPAWIYGCNTGTSCNGGVSLDNKIACQPTTALDACAPAPSCGIASNNASNIWFKFVPAAANATISCFQNSSFVIGIQAFTGGPACGSLTELGCALSSGPSSGVQLHLTGLQANTLYYFRVFGSAGPPSQRTGIYCFCGTTGLNGAILADAFTGFRGVATGNAIGLNWNASAESHADVFEVQRSADGIAFSAAGQVPVSENPGVQPYYFKDASPLNGTGYYRIKHTTAGNQYGYSGVITVKTTPANNFDFFVDSQSGELHISVVTPCTITLSDISGHVLQTLRLLPGTHQVPTGRLANGIYFLHSLQSPLARKCYIFHP